jgi:predicted DNA-binding transcriptional regulator AlpA
MKKPTLGPQPHEQQNATQPPALSSDADLRHYRYNDVANLLSCAAQTIYNGVSTGRFPKPLKTGVGLRFTAEMIRQIIAGEPPQPPVPAQQSPIAKRPRGRPRIATQTPMRSQGGVA